MTENERIIDAFRNCITEPKCKDCPWDECDTLANGRVEIPRDLALAVMRMLTEQEPVKPVLGVLCGDEWYRCGHCNALITLRSSIDRDKLESWHRYCPECGRMVKYDDR